MHGYFGGHRKACVDFGRSARGFTYAIILFGGSEMILSVVVGIWVVFVVVFAVVVVMVGNVVETVVSTVCIGWSVPI